MKSTIFFTVPVLYSLYLNRTAAGQSAAALRRNLFEDEDGANEYSYDYYDYPESYRCISTKYYYTFLLHFFRRSGEFSWFEKIPKMLESAYQIYNSFS